MKKSKKIILIVICAVLLCAIIATTLGVTLSKWKEQAEVTKNVNLDIEKYNPSAPYIIYYGLDGTGNFTDIDSEIVSWAVIGYKGLVAELVIPEVHKDVEKNIEKPVTCILTHNDYINDRLSGNAFITEITIPSSITVIGSGVFSMMSELKKVTILSGDQKLKIGDLAFAGCGKLSTYENNRTTEGNSASYLKGTPIIHQ